MGLTDQGAAVEVQRFCFAPETATLRGTPGAYVNPRGYEGVTARATRAKRANNTQQNSRKATFRSRPGAKAFELAAKAIANEFLYADWKAVFASALGKENAAAPITLSGGTGTVNGATLTGGVPDPLVQVTRSPSGKKEVVSVKSYNGGTQAVVWGYTLAALGGDTISALKNASQASGGCFSESLDAPTSFAVEADQGTEPNQCPFTAQGCIPDIALNFDGERLTFDVTFRGVDWNQATPANTADTAQWDSDFVPSHCELLLQSITSPAVETFQNLSKIGFKLSPQWKPIRGSTSRTSSGANKGDPTFNVKRGAAFVELIEAELTLADTAWVASRTAGTAYQLLLRFYDGDPGATSTRCLAILFRRVLLDDDPEPLDVGGITGHKLVIKVEDPVDADATGTLKTRCALAIFNN